jgi:hypothetical protein
VQAKELGPAGGRACCFLSSKFYFSGLSGTNRQLYLVCFVGDGWVGGLTCDFAGVFGDYFLGGWGKSKDKGKNLWGEGVDSPFIAVKLR